MKANIFQEKLAILLQEVQQQLADYVDFLVQRYQEHPLTEFEK